MIEVRFDSGRLAKIVNDINHHAQVSAIMVKLGVPVIGTLMLRTVQRGVLIMFTEEDIDEDCYVWRWYSDSEWGDFINGLLPPFTPKMVQRQGNGEGFSWKHYGEDDGEI